MVMNKRSLFFILLLIPVLLFAQKEDEQKVNAPVTQVTVFLNGAQITREWQGQLRAGINRLLFDNLSSAIDAKSLQATVEGNLTILSVQYRVNHLRNQVKPAGIQLLEDSLENVTYLLESVRGKKNAFEEEKSMILANKSIGGNNNGVQIAELEDGADFFRKRMTDIIEQIILLKREEKKLQDITQGTTFLQSQYLTKYRRELEQCKIEIIYGQPLCKRSKTNVKSLLPELLRASGIQG
jgi:hypothetical protein